MAKEFKAEIGSAYRCGQRLNQDLGSANGWSKETLKAVAEGGHSFKIVNIGNCLNEYVCEKCGLRYTVDSSD